MKYKLLQLCDILSNKNVCENLFNRFSCPINADVENFLKDKAVEYERKICLVHILFSMMMVTHIY